MKKRLTITDIAKNLNISKTTISFVLNGKARERHISVNLEKKILHYIEKVGYRPNQFAQGLRTGRAKMIGMMVEDISDPFFSAIARMMEENAYKNGYRILYSSTENNTQKTKELINMYRVRQVDGYIIAPPPDIETELNDLVNDGFAVVLFDRVLPDIEINNVVVNNYKSTYRAIWHLIDNGYRNIAMVTLASSQIQLLERQQGYTQALNEIGKPSLIKEVIYHDPKVQMVLEIQDFLECNKQIDAVFFATNYIADSGLESIKNLKLNVPNDIGVIVFDDYSPFRLFTPTITAISQPIKEIAECVINLMLELLSDAKVGAVPQTIVLPTNLMIRDSSAAKCATSVNKGYDIFNSKSANS